MDLSEKRIKHPRNDGFDDAKALFRVLRDAVKHGLEFECAQSFIEAVRQGDTAEQAAWHARCEWDI